MIKRIQWTNFILKYYQIPLEINELYKTGGHLIVVKGYKVVDMVSKVRQFKSENKASLKAEIEDITITSKITDFFKDCEVDIKGVCGVREIKYADGDYNVEIGNIIPEEPKAE